MEKNKINKNRRAEQALSEAELSSGKKYRVFFLANAVAIVSRRYHSLLLSGAAGSCACFPMKSRVSSAPARLAMRSRLLTSWADKGSHTEPTNEGTTGARSSPSARGGESSHGTSNCGSHCLVRPSQRTGLELKARSNPVAHLPRSLGITKPPVSKGFRYHP